MVRAKALAATFLLLALLVACSSELGESCDDEGRVGGDCESGLMCARAKADDVSELVCLKPCLAQGDCGADEVCSGDRGRNLTACRKR